MRLLQTKQTGGHHTVLLTLKIAGMVGDHDELDMLLRTGWVSYYKISESYGSLQSDL